MASDDKKTKSTPAPKAEAPSKGTKTPAAQSSKPATEPSTPAAEPSKTADGEKAGAAPANYSRGEGQKAVSQAYKDNWNDIFAKKKTTTKKKKR